MRKRLKQIFSATLAGIVMCTAITFYPVEAKAAAKAATTDVWEGVDSKEWMSYLDDSLKISEINLPGTHDSATQYVDTENYSQCQNKSITEQLNDGIRFLDIRLKDETGGKLYCVHASKDCYSDSKKKNKLYLDTVLSKCYEFLDAHPGETIVMSMKKDDGNTDDAVIESYIHNYIGNDKQKYWYLDNTTPALSAVRGKIVLMRRYYHTKGDDGHEYENGYGVRIFWSDQGDSAVVTPPWAGPTNVTRYGWVQWCVQDRYKYSDSNKWTAIQQGLDSPPHTTNQKVGDIYITPETTFFLNFMSSAGETTTIFGQEVPNTTPSAIANVINPKFQSYTMEYGKSYGWIIMDFATEQLAKHVYQSNKSPKLEVACTIKALESLIPDTVETDMNLPSAGEAVGGAAGTSITWSCNPANVLMTTGGQYILVRQPSQDVDVTLTATVSSGNYSQQKEFQVLVKKLPEKFAELNTTLGEAEAILGDPANAKYDLDSLEAAVETARALMQGDTDKVSETQIKAAMETLNTIMDREPVLKTTKKLRENLLAWYPLTANSKDVSGNHNNGTATGVTFSEENGVTFTDSGKKQSYISLPTQMFDGKEQMTISFWAKDTKSSGSNTVFGFGSGTEPDGDNSANVYRYVLINTNNNRNLKAVITKNTWRDERGFKGTECRFPANEWAHITCVFDGTKFTLYKNGTLIEAKDTGIKLTDLGTNAVAYIGNSIWTNNDVDYSGSVKDFRVYDCAIAPELIEKIYNDKDMDISSDSGHLIARYPLTADSKNVAGKGKDGVATGVTFSPENGATFKDSGKKQSYISLPTAMFDTEEQMTFSFWAKDTKSSGSNTVFGIGSGTEPDGDNSAGVFKYVLINTNHTNRSLKAVITKNTWRDEIGFKAEECSFPANEWAHITCVFDGTQFTLYKNGTLIGSKDTGIKLTDIGKNTVAYIGNSIWTINDVDYSGSVKDFRIYDCALSEAEAKGLMNESIKDEVMESLISALDLDITKGEDGSLSMSITDAINLPTTVSGGTISWSSDKTDVIDNTGKVTLPAADQPIEDVTLTATVTINGKTTTITFHCEVFTKLDISTADLQAVISSAETILLGLNEADYTTSSWKELQEALEAAKQQLSSPTTQEDIDAVQAALQEKKTALAKLGDKTALNALIDTVKSFKQEDYTTAAWTEFKAALTAAEEAAESDDVTQANVDEAKANLEAKKEALVKRGDKTKLNAAIAAAEALDHEDYTSETWSSFQETLTEVKNTAADIDATAADVAAAEQSLDAAVKALKKITYTVTFKPDNGSEDITKTVERKDKTSAPAEEPQKEGYIFDGWFEADAQEAFDFANTPIMSNVTLTAKWTVKRIVTFNPDNNADTWTVEVKDGGKVTKPSTPVKPGYGFEYWYAEGEESAFDFGNRIITADITLKAKWKEGGHTVIFNPDNNTDTWEEFVKDGEQVTKPETPEKAGYEFEYWYEEGKDGAFDFANTSITANTTLKAKWTKLYKVTFNPDNGSTTSSVDVKDGEKVTKPETPEKAGYEFEYWYAEGQESEFNFANTPITADTTLIAKWSEVQKVHTVTFEPDNGSTAWTETVKDGEKVSMPTRTLEKAGYEFEYWYEEGQESEFDFANTPITANITLKAKWKETQGEDEQNRVVTFNPDNGTAAWTETVKDGEKVTMPTETLEKAGYEFEYWYEEGQDSEFDFANTSITADITLIAKWKETPANATTLKPTVSQEGTGSINVNVDAGSIEPDKKTEVAIDIPADDMAESIKNCEETQVSINVNIPDGMKNNENVDLTTITLPKEALEAARDEGKDLIITVNGDSSYQWVFTAQELASATIAEKNLLIEKDSAKEAEAKLALKDGAKGMAFTVPQQDQGTVFGSVSVDTAEMKWNPGDEVNLSYYDFTTQKLEPVSGTYTVDENGKVTIKPQAGTTYVLWREIPAKVTEVTDVTLDRTSLELTAGASKKLQATVLPEDATDKAVTWKSDNEKVATVAEDGTVTAVEAGEAVITATAGDQTATCKVTVKAESTTIRVTKLKLNAKKLTLGGGEKFTLKVTITPKDATNKKVTWTSSNKKAATVHKTKGVVTAKKVKKPAKTTITATVDGKKITCAVTVKPAPTKIALNAKSVTLKKGKTFQVKVKKYTPSKAASYKLTYSIDKKGKKVVSVDSKGKIKAKKKGKATVTVTTFNKKKATIKITVK